MDKFLLKAFQNLQDVDVPGSLHVTTLRAADFWRYRKYAFILTGLVAATFCFSLWHLYTRMIEADALSVIKAVGSTFEFSFDSLVDSIKTLFQFLPIQSIILFILNLTTFGFMVFLLRVFARLQGRFKTLV